MIPSSPNTIGTHTFRPVSVGYSRRSSVVDGFRPVVAGQYLRIDQYLGQTEFTFLEPPGFRAAEHHYSVNVSPRLIWKVMNSPTVRNPSTIERSIVGADSVNPNAPLPRFVWQVDSQVPSNVSATAAVHGPSETIVTNRFASLSELASWVVSTVRTSTTEGSDSRSTHQFTLLSHHGDGGRSFVTGNPDQVKMPPASGNWRPNRTEDRSREFTPLSLHYYSGRSLVPGFSDPGKPSPMESNSPPQRAVDGMQTVGGVRQSASPQQHDRTYYNATWYVTGAAPHLANTTFLISSVARQAAEERHSQAGFAGRHQVNRKPDVRTGVTKRNGFGGIAAVGVHRPASLIPVIFRTHQDNNPEHETDGANLACLPGGVSAAKLFASTVSMRHIRSESTPTSPSFAMAVPLVVRESPQASSPAERSKSMDFSIQSSPERSNVVPPAQGLPPGLMQQLTEQVVRALDSRTLAASERAGRF